MESYLDSLAVLLLFFVCWSFVFIIFYNLNSPKMARKLQNTIGSLEGTSFPLIVQEGYIATVFIITLCMLNNISNNMYMP